MVRGEKFIGSTLEVIHENDLLEPYSPEKLTKIVPTGGERDNVYEKYRPKKEKVVDYSLSETCIKCRTRDTEIDIKETKATYEFRAQEDINALKKKGKPQYSSGGPPCWVFVDEIWRQKVEATQKVYREKFEELRKERRREENKGRRHLHRVIQALAGPEWYQELSPNQIKTVDRLESCIYRDIESKTTINTRENLAYLGLVPRPHVNKITVALKYCCKCPVEFLLILYQILNPERMQYSQNDRLILSAVVHLTMLMTLRELHIRIPSPPRYRKPTTKSSKRRKKKKYNSPYLIPYTFKPEKPTFTGLYYDKHVQHPECIYFSYLGAMYTRMYCSHFFGDELAGLDSVQMELMEELTRAQAIYNKIHNRKDIRLLLTSLKEHSASYKEFEKLSDLTSEQGGFGLRGKEEKGEKTKAEEQEEKLLSLPSLPPLPDRSIKCKCCEPVEVQTCCEFDEPIDCDCSICKCKEKTTKYVSRLCEKCAAKELDKNAKNIIGGAALVSYKTTVPIVVGTFVEQECDCMEVFNNRMKALEAKNYVQCQKQTYIIAGLVISKCGPVYCMSTVIPYERLCELCELSAKQTEKATKKNCFETCQTDIDEEDTGKNKPNSSENVCVYCPEDKQRNAAMKQCTCQSSSSSYGECRCKGELEKFLQSKCQCDECYAAKRRANATYIISGTSAPIDEENEQTIRLLEGVREFNCNCLSLYKEKIRKFEDYRARVKARIALKSKSTKFALGGIVLTDAGPVYEISGIRPPVECICAKLQRESQEQERQALQRAKMPNTGRIKYEISGVMEGPEENVYILNQAMPVGQCKCEQLFHRYEKVHSACLRTYKEFLQRMNAEIAEYEKEMGPLIVESPTPEVQNVAEKDIEEEEEEEEDVEYDDVEENEVENDKEESANTACVCQPSFPQPCCCTCLKRENAGEADRAAKSTEQVKNVCGGEEGSDTEDSDDDEDEDDHCSCEEDIYEFEDNEECDEEIELDKSTVHCPEDETNKAALYNSGDSKISMLRANLIRYVILKKFPKKIQAQNNLIKKVLAQMAKDGYQLAKLPDCHKLPHFRLWLELRSGKAWTIKDRKRFTNFSISAWGHTNICHKKRNAEVVGVKPADFKNVTWASAEFWKEVMKTRKQQFLSVVKRDFINHAREFFPSTVHYEFPNRTFKDVFFAYCPAKEEDFLIRDTSAI